MGWVSLLGRWYYSDPVLEMPDATIAGVSDPDATRAS